jgi:CheY-like chemotaxis protein
VRVWIVDDNAALATNFGEILEDEGYHVEVDVDPRRALQRLRAPQTAWDVALLDLRMPHYDGPTIGEALRRALPRARLVFVTAYADSTLMERARALAPFEMLEKPVGIGKLVETVQRAIAA